MVSEDNYKFDDTSGLVANQGRKAINVLIDIVGSKTYQIQQGADAVRNILRRNSITGVDLIGIEEDYAFQAPGEQKYHLITLTASYIREG